MSKTNDEAEVIDVLGVANADNNEDGTGNANEETPLVLTRRRANMNCRYRPIKVFPIHTGTNLCIDLFAHTFNLSYYYMYTEISS